MPLWQMLLIGLGGLFLKYCISLALSNYPWKDENGIISEEECARYIEQSNRAVQKTGKIFQYADTHSVIEDGMSLINTDGFSIAIGEV